MRHDDRRRWRDLYGWLMHLLPRDFRACNEEELLAVFDEHLEQRSGSDVLRECLDVLGLSMTLRVAARRQSETMPEYQEASASTSAADVMSSLRQSIRGLFRSPVFSLSVLATMGFGLGTLSVVFTLAWGLWLSPLPYRDPRRLVTVRDAYLGSGSSVSAPELADYETAPAIAQLAAYRYGAVITQDPGIPPQRLTAYAVEPRLFSILGAAPVLGRAFGAADFGSPVVIISDDLWRRRFRGDTSVIGRPLATSSGPLTIVGVMPPGFRFPYWLPSDVWVPLNRQESTDRAARYYSAIGRLRPGATPERAADQMRTIVDRLRLVYPQTYRGWRADVGSLVRETVGQYRYAVGLLLGLVTLLACVSVTNTTSLFLARRLARQREIEVRLALGATAWQLRRLILTESIVLAAVAAVVGIVVAILTAGALAATLPADTPRVADVRVTWQVVVVVSGIALIMALVGGTLSSLRITNSAGAGMLIGGGRSVGGGARHRLRSALVVGEIALSVVLLAGAAVTTIAYMRVMRSDRGFEAQHLATTHLTMPYESSRDPAVRVTRLATVERRMLRLPGVTSAAMSTGYPESRLGTLGYGEFTAGGDPEHHVSAMLIAASPGYFATMRTPIRAGRGFSSEDRLGSARVAVINDAMARVMWPGIDAVGRTLRLPAIAGLGQPAPVEIVGVVADMKLSGRASPIVYVTLAQNPPFWTDVMVRTAGDPSAVIASVERAIRETEPNMLVEQSTTMTAFLADLFALERAQMTLASLFGVLASLLTAIGVYGLLATILAQRAQEISVRRALGAPATAIARNVLLRGARLGVPGVVTGGAVILALHNVVTRYVPAMVMNTVIVCASALSVLMVVTAACAVAAVRAMRIDPARVLR